MEDLLFLCHRIPYPPNKGDKVRAYHLLRFLTQRYRVHLGTFIDDPQDEQHRQELMHMCGGESFFASIHPTMARIKALGGLLTHQALTFRYYTHPGMAQWVDQIVQRLAIPKIMVYSAAPCQFVMGPWRHQPRRIMDLVDVDSEKWQQYAQKHYGPMRLLYTREARTLRAAERAIAQSFDATLFVSKAEAELFQRLAPESVTKINYWENGVDTQFFSPERSYPDPYEGNRKVLVFTGAMDYRPNVEAVVWFARHCFPTIRRHHPKARFMIVGGRPTEAVQRLAWMEGVGVTGTVESIPPYLAHARAAVAPLQIARGVQNKILEAMAMALPVVATPQAMEGLRLCPGLERWVAADAETFIQHLLHLLDEREGPLLARFWGEQGRLCVLQHYNWEDNLKKVEGILEGSP